MVPKIQDFVKNAEMDAESTHWPATVNSSTPSQPIITEAFRARKNSQNSLSRQQAPNISIEEPPILKVTNYQKGFSSSQHIQIQNKGTEMTLLC